MMMRNFITCFFEIILMLIFLQHHHVASLSPIHEKTALFQFKQSLTISNQSTWYTFTYDKFSAGLSYPKTMNWSMSSDHCKWEGVSCDHKTGHVIGLDLSCSQLEGAILPNSTLFLLSHLRFLNLSQNNFSLSNEFPQEFGFFAKGLTHLSLSFTRFSGRVPSEISHLDKLVSLDLSHNEDAKLEDEVFKSLLQNLTQLRVLNLEYLNISAIFPLNLSTSLRVLKLWFTGLHGVLPQEVFHLPKLDVLVLGGSFNPGETGLQAVLPKVKWGSSATLRHLFLRDISFNGDIPDSIGYLESLAKLELDNCNFSGPIPRSIGNLRQLTYLGLSNNNLSGLLPSFVAHLKGLVGLVLVGNGFTGPLPPWLFDISSLEDLILNDNGFTGEFDSSKFSKLVNLTYLDLSSNNFSGVLDFKVLSRLESLKYLDISHNILSVRNTTMATLPHALSTLKLSSCNMKEFPQFSRDAEISLGWVDLSNNDIDGEIPHCIGSVSSYLNLSRNMITGGLEQLPWNSIRYLDLHANKLNGSLPTMICNSSSLVILNLSRNNLSGVLPTCRTNLTSLSVLDVRMNNIQGSLPSTLSNFRNLKSMNLHGNILEGSFPSSFAEFEKLETLYLGNNHLIDTFPRCLEALPNLQVLVLKSNKFHGVINTNSKVEHPFPSLRIIDLSYNEFSGPLPAMYFRNFKAMMNDDVNKIERKYMGDNTYYSDSTNLVIKGVETELVRILTVFTTIDLSGNNFEGQIDGYIGNLVSLRYLNLSHNNLTGHIPSSVGKLLMLESLDLSFNLLKGEIPHLLSSVYTLARLNLSFNQLRGRIPAGPQFNTFENDSYVGNFGLCGRPLSKQCEHDLETKKGYECDIATLEEEDDDYFFSGFTWEAVVIGYGCGVVPAFIIGYFMLVAGKPKWFAGIIARELGLKIRRMEIKWR